MLRLLLPLLCLGFGANPRAPLGQGDVAAFRQARTALVQNSTNLTLNNLYANWQRIAWLGPLESGSGLRLAIDGSARTQRAGLQALESALREGGDVSEAVVRLRVMTEDYLNLLEANPPKEQDVAFLLATELQRQFVLTLGGYSRIDTTQAIPDFVAFLNTLSRWDRDLDLLTPDSRMQLSTVIQNLPETNFATLDRYHLYHGSIKKLYHDLTKGLDTERLGAKHQVAAGALFAPDYLNTVSAPFTPAAAALGQRLFFDPLLSGNWKRTCASCHQPTKAFSDGRSTSMSYDYPNRISRNSPSLIGITTGFGPAGVDLTKSDLPTFVASVFHHPGELNVSLDSVVHRLEHAPDYVTAFRSAYGENTIDSTVVLDALASYVLSLRGRDNSFDRGEAGAAVVRGYNLFVGRAGCGSCHFAPYFGSRRPPHYRTQEMHGAYRTANLRNLIYTAPYGPTGKYVSLESFLIEHYSDNYYSTDDVRDLRLFLEALTLSSLVPEVLPPPALVGPYVSYSNRRAGGMY